MTIEQIDELLAQDEADHPGNPLALHALINAARRKRAHAKAKSTQPSLQAALHADDLALVVAELRKPLTQEEIANCISGMDELCLTLMEECLNDPADLIFGMIRMVRKHWAACRHLGPIEGLSAEAVK